MKLTIIPIDNAVYVEGYNDAFKVTVYENDTIKYLPFV